MNAQFDEKSEVLTWLSTEVVLTVHLNPILQQRSTLICRRAGRRASVCLIPGSFQEGVGYGSLHSTAPDGLIGGLHIWRSGFLQKYNVQLS